MSHAAATEGRRIRCSSCGHLLMKVMADCTCGAIVQETKCKSCAAVLLIRRGRTVEVVLAGTR